MNAEYPRIAMQGIDGIMFVRKNEILYAIADGNYSHVYLTEQRTVKVPRKIKELCELLPDSTFVRIHRSHLINLEHLVRFNMDGVEAVNMSDGRSLSVARDRKASFIKRFTKL